MSKATIISADQAGINRQDISENALQVVRDLQAEGFQAYLVGGCVRDLLLHMRPKDFDVATDATPDQIKSTFKNSRIIGRRFKLVHVRFGYDVIEVATFRANASDRDEVGSHEMSEGDQGQLLRDNVYGSIEEDVVRRDFRANALYYDPIAGEVLDFMGSMEDIKARKMVSIGDPKQRFREDPVRMLRVIRFAAKLGFEMEPEALEMIAEEGSLLSHVSSARLFEEVLKLFHGGAAYDTYLLLRQYGLFKYLFPFTDQCVVEGVEGMPERALKNTDKRITQGKPVIPAFLFACMMWDPVKQDAQILMEDGTPEPQAWRIAMNDGLRDQSQYVAVPRRLADIILDIWNIHFRLIKRNPRMVKASLNNRRFRAAYDFLLLRSALHEVDQEIADWWTEIQEVESGQKEEMIVELGKVYKSARQRQDRHRDGEANGNSINYNSDAYGGNYNQSQDNGQRPQGQHRNRSGKKRPGGKRHSARAGKRPGGSRAGGPRRSSRGGGQGGRRNKPYGEQRYNEARPADEYGHHSSSTSQKKVKVRRKRRVSISDRDNAGVASSSDENQF